MAKLSVQSPSPRGIGSDCQCNIEVGKWPGANNMVAQLGKCSPASLKWLGLSLCPLLSQAVRALTVMLHRQWLTVRRAGGRRTPQQKQTVRCLRDTVLLLHSLSQKDKLFTVHCVEVLHQYDQVMPGVSMLIRALPDVTDCEGKPVLAYAPLPEVHENRLLCWTSVGCTCCQSHSWHCRHYFLFWFFEYSRLPFDHVY